MEETIKGKPTLICKKLNGREELEGMVLGVKGFQMELMHKRLGHTSLSGMERLVREQIVRGLEDGIDGDFGMCKIYKMGKSSEKPHPRKGP